MTPTSPATRSDGQTGVGAMMVAPTPMRRRRKSSGQRRAQWVALGFVAPVVIYLCLFYVYPLYKNIDLSLRDYTVASFVQGHAPFAGLQNFTQAIRSSTFWPAMFNTMVFVFGSIVVQFVLGLALAVFFYKNFRLSSTLRALFLIPWLLPMLVSASTWSWLLNSDSGLVNWLLSLVGLGPYNWLTSPHWAMVSVLVANIWIGIPFNLVLMYSGLQGISSDVHEAAVIDGANGWQRFWKVTFPLLRPVSAITLLLGFIYTLKVFDIVWIMTRGGPSTSSTTLAIWAYQLSFGSALPQFSSAAAVGTILIVIALAFGLLYASLQHRLEAQ